MTRRMDDAVTVVVGAGQTPGETIGNGRAIALRLAREGAKLVAVDRDARSADETCEMIAGEGGVAVACHADITSGEDRSRIVASAVERFGRIDVLVNNVGIGVGDGGPTSLSEEAWDQIFDVNLKSMWLT